MIGCPCPGGTADTSPPIYRWDTGIFKIIRPGGTFDIHPGIDPWEMIQECKRAFALLIPTVETVGQTKVCTPELMGNPRLECELSFAKPFELESSTYIHTLHRSCA